MLEDIQNTVAELNKILEMKKVEVDEKKAQAEIIEAIVKVEKEIVETGDILANITLFDNLEKSNVISDDIKIKVSEGQKTDEYINTFSEK